MRFATAAILAGIVSAPQAAAQAPAETMTCAQAVAYFASNGVIYKTVHGKLLPIRIGSPIATTGTLECRGRGRMQRRYSVKTVDQPRCAVSLYCE